LLINKNAKSHIHKATDLQNNKQIYKTEESLACDYTKSIGKAVNDCPKLPCKLSLLPVPLDHQFVEHFTPSVVGAETLMNLRIMLFCT